MLDYGSAKQKIEMVSNLRKWAARVELYENGNETLLDIYRHTDRLKSITIERACEEGKFFGVGVCQKVNIHLLDKNRELNITTGNNFEVVFNLADINVYPYPIFYVSEVHRDELTNELSITAYDGIYKATSRTVNDLGQLPAVFTLRDYAHAIAANLGFPIAFVNCEEAFNLAYDRQANFDGTESLREALNALAEATQTIYYIDSQWRLTFKRLDISGNKQILINKNLYIDLDSGENRRLAAICSATELGDNLTASLSISGTTQYIRDNPFWDMRDDRAALVEKALIDIGGITINQFECNWRGNIMLEIGDKIELQTKDNNIMVSYVLDDVITYDGGLSEKTRWQYTTNEVETDTNPTSLGDAIKQTYARVDKANKEIEMVASAVETNTNNISALRINTNSINAYVSSIQEQTNQSINNINTEITTLTKKVEAAMDEESVRLTIQQEMENGVEKISTTTGYTFDADGLRISKTGTEMESLLNEDGLSVYRDAEEVLRADNTGVNGINMTVRQYLIVGGSRFENYGGRTGCFWIG